MTREKRCRLTEKEREARVQKWTHTPSPTRATEARPRRNWPAGYCVARRRVRARTGDAGPAVVN